MRRNKHKSKPEEEIVRIPNGIPAILSADLWERTQKRLEKNKKGRGANSAKEIYLLSGLVYCSKCNGGMYGQRKFAGKTGIKYKCYACGTRYRNHLCDMTSINSPIREMIFAYLKKDMDIKQKSRRAEAHLPYFCQKGGRLR